MSQIQTGASFLVALFTTRTTNALESSPGTAKLPALWQKFKQTFPDYQGEIYSIYTNYQTDQDGEYTCGVGIRIESKDDCPSDMEGLVIPAANYLAYPADGQQPQGVLQGWQKVWADFGSEHAGLRRTFTTDYELHAGSESVTIYIAVRNAP